jgi:hypothetical protein
MNVLVIPEDCRKDEHILQPIIEAMMHSLGKGKARVRVCTDPILGGVGQALRWERVQEIITKYQGMVQLFLLCVDRDGLPGRREALERIEQEALEFLREDRQLLAENAWQELEVWLLAGLDLPSEWECTAVRQEVHPKETYFLPLVEQRGLLDHPFEGRKTLAREAAAHYRRIKSRCPEDIANLDGRIRAWTKRKSK